MTVSLWIRETVGGKRTYRKPNKKIYPEGTQEDRNDLFFWVENQSTCVRSTLTKAQVGKHKSLARHDFSDLDRQVVLEHRACVYEGVKFSVLAAGIDV